MPLRACVFSVITAQENVVASPVAGARFIMFLSRMVNCEAVGSSVSAMASFIRWVSFVLYMTLRK